MAGRKPGPLVPRALALARCVLALGAGAVGGPGCAPDPSRCSPADEAPAGPFVPSQERRALSDPMGGARYDARLAGCSGSHGGVWDFVYDPHGRLVVGWGIDSGVTYTWDDVGCLVEERAYEAPDREWVASASVCDNHGYPICVADDRDGFLAVVNTYVDDVLVEAVSALRRETYTWRDGKVVERTREEDGEVETIVAEWAGDWLVGATTTVDGEVTGAWSSTLDEHGRIVAIDGFGGPWTGTVWVYANDVDPLPSELRNADGELLRYIGVSCEGGG